MKNRLKKLSSIFISAVMLFSLLSVSALAANQPTITVGDGSVDLSSGTNSVTVPVSISGNTGLAGLKLSFALPDGVTVSNVSRGSGSDNAITIGMFMDYGLEYPAYEPDNTLKVALAGARDTNEDGVLFWITFAVSNAAAKGDSALAVECEEFYSASDLNTNRNAAVATQSGTLTVSGSATSSSGSGTTSSGSGTTSGSTGNTSGSVSFTDVVPGSYYADAVAWAVARNITDGTSATTFSPDASCTRAQAVTFLWRAAGCPAPTQKVNPFNDVSLNDYYYDAVLWANEQGITSGTSATTFSPNQTCNRAQIVTFLYRQAGEPAAAGASFADVDSNAYYASAVAWAVARNITDGTSATTFSPDASCTRSQIVTFLYRAAA